MFHVLKHWETLQKINYFHINGVDTGRNCLTTLGYTGRQRAIVGDVGQHWTTIGNIGRHWATVGDIGPQSRPIVKSDWFSLSIEYACDEPVEPIEYTYLDCLLGVKMRGHKMAEMRVIANGVNR